MVKHMKIGPTQKATSGPSKYGPKVIAAVNAITTTPHCS
jgi:hypothetical protein